MLYGYWMSDYGRVSEPVVKVGRPKRDRKKIAAARRARRH